MLLRSNSSWLRTKNWQQYLILMRLNRPIGIFLLLWPTLWALWIASAGHPDALVLTVFVLGVIVMRSAGCVINDYADRHIDPYVKRTQDRPLAAGRVTARESLTLFVILCIIALLLVMLMNSLTILLSLVAVILAATYPFMKRYTYLPQIYLGAAFAWAVPMAFAAQLESVPKISWLLFVGTVLWATIYDTMYAMVDREDDVRIGVKSTAILFGDSDRAIIGAIQIVFIIVMTLVGKQIGMGIYYYGGLVLASLLAIYQQVLIKRREPQQCFRAFVNNNWFGAVIFTGIMLHYWVEA